jgi:hypothetical protein
MLGASRFVTVQMGELMDMTSVLRQLGISYKIVSEFDCHCLEIDDTYVLVFDKKGHYVRSYLK